MRKELQFKFLTHLNTRKKSNEEGFTLIELLVVIIIIGILAAIALPSLLGQANKAKQSEARQNTGSMMRGQQAFYLENSGFTTSISNLGLGIQTSTNNYSYAIAELAASGTNDKFDTVGVNGIPGGTGSAKSIKWYVGNLQTGIQGTGTAANETTTLGTLCESSVPVTDAVTPATAETSAVAPASRGSQHVNCLDATIPNPTGLPTATPRWKDLGS